MADSPVQVLAQLLHDRLCRGSWRAWDDLDPEDRDEYLTAARAVIDAMPGLGWTHTGPAMPDGPICPRCGNGAASCADGYRHEDTCTRYRYTRDVCADCAAAMAVEPAP